MRGILQWIGISILIMMLLIVVEWPDKNLHIVACDIGQGDAILIWHGFSQVLIDSGPSSQVEDCLVEYLPWIDKTLEMVVLTHADADHIGGLRGVLDYYTVNLLVANGVGKDTQTFEALRALVAQKQIPVHVPKMGDRLKVGALDFLVLWPKEKLGDQAFWQLKRLDMAKNDDYITPHQGQVLGVFDGDANDISVVLRLEYGRTSSLMTGDISTREELALVAHRVITPVDVLKIAHHGSKSSSDRAFLELLSPEWAIISVGAGNRYGHPAHSVLTYLDIVGAKTLRTDIVGDIHLMSDGDRVWRR